VLFLVIWEDFDGVRDLLEPGWVDGLGLLKFNALKPGVGGVGWAESVGEEGGILGLMEVVHWGFGDGQCDEIIIKNGTRIKEWFEILSWYRFAHFAFIVNWMINLISCIVINRSIDQLKDKYLNVNKWVNN
jgi:hypothetical protein